MNNYRLSVKNNTNNEIRKCIKILEKAEITKNNLRQQKISSFITKQIGKLQDKIVSTKQKIKELKKKLIDIDTGALDKEIEQNLAEEYKKMKEKIDSTNLKKKNDSEIKQKKSVISKDYYEKNRQATRKQRYNQRGWKSCYNYFSRTCAKLPNYMRKNLKKMPNNKGYFWRDIVFYGELPCNNSKSTVLFQKERNGSMIIHEWTKKYYFKYCKKTKNDKKKLIFKKVRNIKN